MKPNQKCVKECEKYQTSIALEMSKENGRIHPKSPGNIYNLIGRIQDPSSGTRDREASMAT
jgi:hypothetical protein